MYKVILFTLMSQIFFAQENLVMNPSLEQWGDYIPKHWRIVSNSVDIFKSNIRVIPWISPNDIKFSKCFPRIGSDGITYFGIANDEIIEGQLSKPLIKDQKYTFSFWVSKPPHYASKVANNKVSVKFTKHKAPTEIAWNKIKNYIEVFSCDSSKFNSVNWKQASVVFKAKGGEKYFQIGFFRNLNTNLGLQGSTVYNQFDDFYLIQGEHSNDICSVYYKNKEFTLNNKNKTKLNEFLNCNNKEKTINIKSYTSKLGTENFNNKLGQKRIKYVVKYIKSINPNIEIKALNFGERFSIENRDSIWRRVDIYFDKCKILSKKAEPKFNQKLISQLSKIEDRDQEIRNKYEFHFRKNPNDSIKLTELEKEMSIIDSSNILAISEIIDEFGYPGLTLVGPEVMDVAFLVLQHSPLEIRLKYMENILQASKSFDFNKQWLPYMIDRNKIDMGEKQIYGTQLKWNNKENKYVLYPIENIEQVDKLRKKYKLGKLDDYLKSLNKAD